MAYQLRPWESNLLLFTADYGYTAVPVVGLTFDQIHVKYRKAGATALATKTLVAADWVEIGDGLYVLKWSAEDMSAVGPFYANIYGSLFDQVVEEFDVIEAPLGVFNNPSICIVTGNIVDLGGHPAVLNKVTFRPVKMPVAIGATGFLSAEIVPVYPDAFGNFSVQLIRGMSVIVESDPIGVRQQVTIPNQAVVALRDILPPIP
jgi:hypothetical protein